MKISNVFDKDAVATLGIFIGRWGVADSKLASCPTLAKVLGKLISRLLALSIVSLTPSL